MSIPRRLPISARHAFALAFDLAVRRDPVQSLWVPLLLHAPWLMLQAMLPAPDQPGGMTATNLGLNSVSLLGDFAVSLLVAGMLRFRARSVYAAAGSAPAGAFECYARALGRLPWLFATELARNLAMFFAGVFLILPGIWVGFRLSLATEAVVLRHTGPAGAFARSYQLTSGRLERWLEMIASSVVLVLCVLFTCALGFFALPATGWATWATVALFLLPLVMTVIQYAWTFFYLRLEEIDVPGVDELGAGAGGGTVWRTAGGAAPKLRLIERDQPRESERP